MFCTPRAMAGTLLAFGLALATLATGPALASSDRSHPADEPKLTAASPNRDIPSITKNGEPFGLADQSTPGGPLWNKRRTVEAAIEDDAGALMRCRANAENCSPSAHRMLAIIDAARSRSGRARLGEVNRAINLTIRPVSDLRQHGVLDQWTGPLATLASGQGDCEDYVIAKYVILREAGVAAEDLRFVVVRDEKSSEDHAFLAARLDGRWLMLDNRRMHLVEDRDVARVVPLFAFSLSGARPPTPMQAAGLPQNGQNPADPGSGIVTNSAFLN